jgi:hypothetical protein
MNRFVERFPVLFHVTERSAVASIRRHGLLSAAAVCDLFEASPDRRPLLLEANRDRYEQIEHPGHGIAVLRRQLMRDHVIATRLADGLSPPAWRSFINGLVFFAAEASRAIRLRGYDFRRDQVILRWHTAALLDAGIELRFCRYNNGMVDRTPLPRRRLRSPQDYLPISQFAGGQIAEVAAASAIPPGIPFTLDGDCGSPHRP